MAATLVESHMKVFQIPMSEILSDADFNCRGSIAPIDVVDLARSIGDDGKGLQQPIVVQPYRDPKRPNIKYRIVSGHRRHAAFRVLGLDAIPATIMEGLSELQARKMNLEENLKRQDLNMLQEARAIQHFKVAGLTQEDVAKELGMSRGWVQVRFNILELPPEIQQEVAAGFLSQEQIKELHTLPKTQQFEVVRRIKTAKLNGEKGRIKVRHRKINPLAKRPRSRDEIFKMQDTVQDVVGNNFGTRALAWAAGEISDFDFLRDLRDLARERGVPYEIPAEIVAAVQF